MIFKENFEIESEKINKKSEDLMFEFDGHYREVIKNHPEVKDRKREIFEAWSIQKIAGLQLVVIELAKKLNKIIENREN